MQRLSAMTKDLLQFPMLPIEHLFELTEHRLGRFHIGVELNLCEGSPRILESECTGDLLLRDATIGSRRHDYN